MKIAIIDDSDVDRYLARRVVRAGFEDAEIAEFESAEAAIDAVRASNDQREPLVVLLDINMPRMNGFEFLDAVDPDVESPPIVIVMLTSSSAREDQAAASKYRCVRGYFEKPLTPEHVGQISSLLGAGQ